MSDYIRKYRQEHAQIMDALLQVPQLGISSPAGQRMTQALKENLLGHLESEDDFFYPVLRKAAETDADLRRELFLFAADMNEITAAAMAFFKKQGNDPLDKDIPAEFGRLSALITSRIAREENILMKEFERIVSQ